METNTTRETSFAIANRIDTQFDSLQTDHTAIIAIADQIERATFHSDKADDLEAKAQAIGNLARRCRTATKAACDDFGYFAAEATDEPVNVTAPEHARDWRVAKEAYEAAKCARLSYEALSMAAANQAHDAATGTDREAEASEALDAAQASYDDLCSAEAEALDRMMFAPVPNVPALLYKIRIFHNAEIYQGWNTADQISAAMARDAASFAGRE